MARNASPKQIKFITDLFDALLPRKDEAEVQAAVAPLVATIQAARNGGPVDGYEAKRAIDAMLPFSPRQAAGPRSNKYAGKCGTCGTLVAEGAGRIEKSPAGRWVTYHLTEVDCFDAKDVAPVVKADEAGEALTPGIYRAIDGGTWKVTQAKAGHLYAMAGTILPDTKPSWEFVKGGMRNLVGAHRLTADEAAAIGHLTSHCCFCGIELTDDGEGRSVQVGYGPVCAKNNGLPWG